MNKDVIIHYDLLIDEGQDPANDPPPLKAYMDKWDGEPFLKLLELDSGKRVLEIGCGTGRLAIKVAPLVNSFCGIDISPKTIEAAKSHLELSNVKLICDDFLVHSFDEQFDLIYSSLTFMHIKNKLEAIEKIHNCLTKNGICVLSIDKSQNDVLDYGTRKLKIYPDDPEEITDMFQKCGFCEIEKHQTEHAYLIKAKKK
ncbi:MAG: class I SAM-dependent methyltransferase [Ruminococcaceae bacterium]|nr:class I SAM-dependent methyltransferase [Oscillospiraceae bacterium]